MNEALLRSNVSPPQSQSEPFTAHAFAAGMSADLNRDVMHDIQRRATTLGPVFEEMFLYHWEQFNWEHWGVNE